MWAIMASPMLLSQNIRNLTKFQLETYLNKEIIAVGQDPLGRQGQKLFGGDLAPNGKKSDPALTLQPCNPKSFFQTWKWNASAPLFLQNVDSMLCANVDDCGASLIGYQCVTSGGTCAGPSSYANEQFMMMPDGTLQSLLGNNMCVTHQGVGYSVKLSRCSRAPEQIWKWNPQNGTLESSGNCLSVGGPVGPRGNIWGRPLGDGSWAIAFINAEESSSMDLTCDQDCLSITGWDPYQKLRVRDLWRHTDLSLTTPQAGISVKNLAPSGGIECFKLSPVWN